MKRKVIQIGDSTVLVSIPSKWAKKYNFKKGESVDVEEEENRIVITTEKHAEQELKKFSFNADNLNERSFKYTMSAVHKMGFSEITINFEKNNYSNSLDEMIKNTLLGFVTTEQTSKKIVIKSVENQAFSELEPLVRRTFLVTMSLADSSFEMISSENFNDLMSLLNLEKSNNQLTSFCLRLINKGSYKEEDKKIFIAIIMWNLEKIADEYKSICMHLSRNNKKISKEILNLYKEVNNILKSYYNLFYNFSFEKLNELSENKKLLSGGVYKGEYIMGKLNEIKSSTAYETKLLVKLSTILSKIIDMLSSIVALNLEKIN